MSQNQLKTIAGFSQLIQTLEGGALHADLSDAVQSIINKMVEHSNGTGNGRSVGELNIKLTFGMELETIKVRAKIAEKTPEVPRRMSALFVTPNNKLSLEHPMQNALPFGTVVTGGQVQQPSAMVVHSDTEQYDRNTGEIING